jgi:tetratricopeptide (TPR) repeat protein
MADWLNWKLGPEFGRWVIAGFAVLVPSISNKTAQLGFLHPKAMRFALRFGFALIFTLGLSGCTIRADELELRRAKEAQAKHDTRRALVHFLRLRELSKDQKTKILATEEAARICFYETKDYVQSLELWRSIIDLSVEPSLRYQAQKMIAEIEFTHRQSYLAAIVELNKFLDLKPIDTDWDQAKLALSKAYFYTNNYFQSRVEAEDLKKATRNDKAAFEAMRMIASSFQGEKKLDEAAASVSDTIKKYPEPSKQEKLGLILAIIYEEKKDFKKAIETLALLKSQYPDQEFIDRRMASLKSRALQQPGARGLKK